MVFRRYTISVGTAAVAAFGGALAVWAAPARPAVADIVHPWCVVYQEMNGTWVCAYDTFEQCRDNARGGNTGFCTANPAFREPALPVPARKSRSRPR